MPVKTILVPVELGEHLTSTLDTALLLGRVCDAHVAGVALGVTYMVVGPMGGMVVATQGIEDQPAAEELQRRFSDFMARHSIEKSDAPKPGLSSSWHIDEVITDVELGSISRIFDFTVIGRPNPGLSAPRVGTVEAVLFEGGRPVIIAPPTAPKEVGKNILLSWNGSTEAARAVSFAMPLLEAAEKVTVFTVEDAVVAGPTGAELCANLKAHGIEAEESSVPGSVSAAGEIIADAARDRDCDLIVKGAYTHSRLRQMVFGGPTSHLIHNTELPLLMAS